MSTTKENVLHEKIGLHKPNLSQSIFGRGNLTFMAAGIGFIALGLLLMAGGKSDEGTFQPEKVYSTTRIVIAPILITLGLLIEIYAIMRKNND